VEPPGPVVGAGVPAEPEEERAGPGVEVSDRPGTVGAVDRGEPDVVDRVVGDCVAVAPGEDALGVCVALELGVSPDVVLEVGVGVTRLLAGAGRTCCRRSTGAVPSGTGRTMT
jgi:hypothetical protein